MGAKQPGPPPATAWTPDPPACPVHGPMTYAGNSGCLLVRLGARNDCVCRPAGFVCHGFDGEGCEDTPPVPYRGWLAGQP